MDRFKRKFGFYILASIFMLSTVFGAGILYSNIGEGIGASTVVEESEEEVESVDNVISANADYSFSGQNPTMNVASGSAAARNKVSINNAYITSTILSGLSYLDVYVSYTIFDIGSASVFSGLTNSTIYFDNVAVVSGNFNYSGTNVVVNGDHLNRLSSVSVGGVFSSVFDSTTMTTASSGASGYERSVYNINFWTAVDGNYWSGAWDFQDTWGFPVSSTNTVATISSWPKLLSALDASESGNVVRLHNTYTNQIIKLVFASGTSTGQVSIENTHFTRNGWSHLWSQHNPESAGSGEVVGSETVTITMGGDLYTVWRPNKYSITYNANGGTGSNVTVRDIVFESSFTTKASNTFSRTGYTFKGWSANASTSGSSFSGAAAGTRFTGSQSLNANTSYIFAPSSAGNKTLYAIWQINTYTLTINYTSAQVSTATNLNISQSASTVSSGSIAVNGTATVKHTYSTSALAVGLSAAQGSASGVDYYIRIGSAPTVSAYNGIDSCNYSWTPNSNATIKVYIYQRYTVSFNGNGNTGGTVPSTTYKIYGTNLTISANSLSRTGYSPNGWNTSATLTSSPKYTTSYTANANVTLYANWKANPYTITYKANGGSGSDTTQNPTYNASFSTKANPFTRTGYTFKGWSTNASTSGSSFSGAAANSNFTGSGNLSANTNYKYLYAGDTVLYAIWNANSYKITYKANGGSGSDTTQNPTYNASFSTKANPFTRTGYTFKGWSTNASTSGSSFSGAAANSNFTGSGNLSANTNYKYLYAGDTVLYAIWSINTYTLTINYTSAQVSTATNLNISQNASTVSSGSIAKGSSSTVKHSYSTSALTVALSAAQGSANGVDYYIRVGSAPTTSSYNGIDSYNYSWTPDSNDTINVYIYQRYTVSFNGNGNTGGTVPTTTYKIHGTNLTISANALTRTGYTPNGWNTSATLTTTPAYTTSYTANANATLYANWTINTYTLTINYHGDSSYTNATNLNISQSSSTVSSGSIAKGSSATVKHSYSTSALTVTLSAAQSSTYSYYISVNAKPSTSSAVNTTTYSWTHGIV